MDVGITSETTDENRNRIALTWDDTRQEARLYVLWRDSSVGGQERAPKPLRQTTGGASWTPTRGLPHDALDRSAGATGYGDGISIAFAGEAPGRLPISANSNDTVGLISCLPWSKMPAVTVGTTLIQPGFSLRRHQLIYCRWIHCLRRSRSSPGFRAVWSSATGTNKGTAHIADLGSRIPRGLLCRVRLL